MGDAANTASLMQLSLNSMEKMRFFAKEEPLEYLKALEQL